MVIDHQKLIPIHPMANQIAPMTTNSTPLPFHYQEPETKASSEKNQETKPLTFPSPSSLPPPIPDEEEADYRRSYSSQYLHKRRCLLCFSGCCGVTILIIGFVILILSFTVLKVKEPTLTMNGVHLDNFDLELDTWQHPVSLNATLTADITLQNPNIASFRYDNSTTEFYYRQRTVGVAYAPEGKVGANSAASMKTTINVMVDRIVQTGAGENIVEGRELNLTSFTDITGKVDVIGIYKRDMEVMLNCSMTVDLNPDSQVVRNTQCVAFVS